MGGRRIWAFDGARPGGRPPVRRLQPSGRRRPAAPGDRDTASGPL